MNPYLKNLQPYPFERLRQLKAGVEAPTDTPHIALSIGEPKHQAPAIALSALQDNLQSINQYPATRGMPHLREDIARWATARFELPTGLLDAEHHVLPVNGTREALFAFAQAVVDARAKQPVVLMPNPFYQIYEGAALLAGARPHFLNCEAPHYKPDLSKISEAVWRNCQLFYLCTPGNPSGAVYSEAEFIELIALADKYDFVIASDECYSELYFDEGTPPAGLLGACARMGRKDFARCVVFHSLSKRSNLPGLRSGFVAGDQHIIQTFLRYRTYHGCAMPPYAQYASAAAWNDEQHVLENRQRYRQKFTAVLDILGDCLDLYPPSAGFYLWPRTPIDDQLFTRELFSQENVTVLPGSFLARDTEEISGEITNPGKNRVRLALVAPLEECEQAAWRIKRFVERL